MWLSAPVAVTVASAVPRTASVPDSTGSPFAFSTGSDSPVSTASSTASPCASSSVASAGTRSPASKRTTSPVTSSALGTALERAVAQHPALRRREFLQSRERRFGALLLEHREARVRHEHDRDDDRLDRHAAAAVVDPDRQRHEHREHQHRDERAAELAQPAQPDGLRRGLRQRVGAAAREPAARLGGSRPRVPSRAVGPGPLLARVSPRARGASSSKSASRRGRAHADHAVLEGRALARSRDRGRPRACARLAGSTWASRRVMPIRRASCASSSSISVPTPRPWNASATSSATSASAGALRCGRRARGRPARRSPARRCRRGRADRRRGSGAARARASWRRALK